jgi:hypothetical protein
MFYRVGAFILGACLLGAACATDRAPPQTLDLKPYVGRLVTLETQIGDRSAPMLFDTGAGVTAITPQMAQAFDCVPYGRLTGSRMDGERVDFEKCGRGTLAFDGYESATDVFDLMALLPEDLPELGGIVSLANFADRPFTLDLAGKKLIVENERSLRERTANAKEGDLRIIRGPGGPDDITVLVRIEDKTDDLWFLLDSGNLDKVFVTPHALAQMGLSEQDLLSAGEDGVYNLSFEIAGAIPVTAEARVRDIIYDGALSEDVLRRYLITFDLENEKIWFSTPVQ